MKYAARNDGLKYQVQQLYGLTLLSTLDDLPRSYVFESFLTFLHPFKGCTKWILWEKIFQLQLEFYQKILIEKFPRAYSFQTKLFMPLMSLMTTT